MNSVWDYTLFNNTIREWGIAIGIILVSILLIKIFSSVVIRRVQGIAAGTQSTIDDFIVAAIKHSAIPMMVILAFYVGLGYLDFPPKVKSVLHVALMATVTFFGIRFITFFVRYLFGQSRYSAQAEQQRARRLKGILLILQTILWLAGLLFLVDNLGYNITTIVAGLGIGGIAIALAAQAILGDLFSYLVIFFDKPFEEGDFITLDDKMGTVEYIGIKTTRLRTLGGEQLICSNTDLTNSRVHNYKRMQQRRVVFSFGVVYSTPVEALRKIPGSIKNIIESLSDTKFDRAHFQAFGNFSLNFEVVYYVLSADFNTYMDLQQTINLRLLELFEQQSIEFAFPTQTVIFDQPNTDPAYPAKLQHD